MREANSRTENQKKKQPKRSDSHRNIKRPGELTKRMCACVCVCVCVDHGGIKRDEQMVVPSVEDGAQPVL
jgi:hypothetical protein